MTSAIGNRTDFDALGLARPPEARNTSLGQQEFLSLMLTQLKNQDPFKPLESGEFLGQLAQFGTVNGLAELKSAFDGLASSLLPDQKLAAANLIGRSVLVTSAHAQLREDAPVTAAVELPRQSESLRIQIRDAAGTLVREIGLGSRPAGLVRFEWDGITESGTRADPGRYGLSAQYFDGAAMQGAATFVTAPVESVRFGARGIALQLGALGELPFSAVQEIG